ncbi:hypothetical protein IMSHALPRED_007110 [Imshaugia aleurites]|uniref:Uncharacterized protein n=1 Tax=Imshaugia aleurites TaxID=172621 RepID=A0A8H3FL35_9LECA|nr:hypothetical protein IMSHALPRED_007110 [Imshaugia aleurites]
MSGGDKEQGDQFLDEVTASDQGKDQADESPDFIQGGLVRDYQISTPATASQQKADGENHDGQELGAEDEEILSEGNSHQQLTDEDRKLGGQLGSAARA